VTRRRGRRRKKVLDELKERREHCKLKEEALDQTLWRTRFRRGYGPVVRQITV
jgi:transcription elongation GreA/GreB family factor